MIVPVALGERSYPIQIKAGLLGHIDTLQLPKAALPGEIVLISNNVVGPLYADPLANRLRAAGQKVTRYDAPDGEAAKTLSSVSACYDALAAASVSRRAALWAVGGGVTGDMAGFVAASWMRGIHFVQVPTTLLAMVDSSVGGKVGINHAAAKNLIGAFWQPASVLIDPTCLQTLPPREIKAGLAEVIKYGVIADAEFFEWLEANLEAALNLETAALSHIIGRSCQLKAEVVGEDERESDGIGRRATLNYGHTVGHALEAVTQYGELLHGEAIAIGMTVAARLARLLGTLPEAAGEDLIRRQTRLFQRAGLPTEVPGTLPFEKLWTAMTLDKKTRGNSVNFMLPTSLGHVAKFDSIAPETVRTALAG